MPAPEPVSDWSPLPRDVAGPESVMQFAAATGYEADHAHHVTRLAVTVFDLLQDVHRLSGDDRLCLQCGALLHDIGWLYGQKAHHKAVAEMILSAELPGLSERQKLLTANIARYHRKSLPKATHKHYATLDDTGRHSVCALGGILRLCDGLDRSHRAVVNALACRIRLPEITLQCRTTEPAPLETTTASRKADLIQAALQCTLTVEMIAQP